MSSQKESGWVNFSAEAFCMFHGAWFSAQWGELMLGSLDQRGITEGEFASMQLGVQLLSFQTNDVETFFFFPQTV